jgi:hypothetical protein
MLLARNVFESRSFFSNEAIAAVAPNQEETEENRLPAPEQPLLERLDTIQLAELIERHIEYVDPTGRPVHLPETFVRHYLRRDLRRGDGSLPIANAVVTTPMVLPGGVLLSGRGLNRRLRIVFRVPTKLEAILPRPEECTPSAAASAMRFLTDEWLRDVATDYDGKCIAIARALTIIQRLLLPERPASVISGGKRGTGKTTLLNMTSMAVNAVHATAAAWSPSEEERRKALFAYLLAGVPEVVWDNIPRGTAASCHSIEKALTAETYNDRILGVSKVGIVPAFTVQSFTGNNITARGDLASRVLNNRLIADRPDPKNRNFLHADPIGWTRDHRGARTLHHPHGQSAATRCRNSIQRLVSAGGLGRRVRRQGAGRACARHDVHCLSELPGDGDQIQQAVFSW